MKAKDAVLIWTPKQPWNSDAAFPGTVRVTTKPFDRTRGDRWVTVRTLETKSEIEMVAAMFIHFHTMVVRDGIDPQAAHDAFLAIDEYRERISPDIPGADAD